MTAWLFLVAAVASNVAANFMFKKAMASFPSEITFTGLLTFAFNPFLWLGAVLCGVLLASYLLALRETELVVAYAFVISGSLIGITVLSPWVVNGEITTRSTIGVLLVIAGLVALISQDRTATVRVPQAETSRVESDART